MSERTPHPDYLAVPEEHRWGKPLPALFEHLMAQSYKRRGAWTWYVLPGGALVSMRINEADYHRELRIARKTAPTASTVAPVTDEAIHKWRAELDVFLAKFGGPDRFEELPGDPTTTDVTYRMLFKGEKVAVACAHCGKPAEPGPYKEPLCTECAIKAGEDDSRRMRLVR